jgi:hypothetical protein
MHLRGLWIACAPESDRSRSARSSASGPALYHWVRMPRTGGKRHGDRPGGPPPGQLWQRVLPVTPVGPPPSELRRAIRRDRPGRSDRAGRNADRESSAGAPGDRPGAANEPWKERSFQGRLAAPSGRSRSQSRSRTAWLPDPRRRGRGSPQRRPLSRNLRGKRRIGAAFARIFR